MEITTPRGTLKGKNIEAILRKYGRNCLQGADLHGADLNCTDLSGANLRRTDLSHADLSGANLSHADLYRTDLSHADLTNAELSYANLTDADLTDATHLEPTIARTSILPDEGDVIGWKKAAADYGKPIIVKLLIPADAQRSNSTGRKCRASKARILDLQDLDGDSLPPDTTARSQHDRRFTYQKGETVHAEDFDTNRWNECAPGIHFFITRREAVEY